MAAPTWLSALPVALAAAFWVIVPGLLVTRAIGVRGITAWALAPLVSTTTISISAVLGTLLGFRWGPWVPLAAALVVAVLAGLFRGLVARRPADSVLYHGWRTAISSWGPGRRLRAAWVRMRTPRGRFARAPEELTTALPQVWPTSAQRDGIDGRHAGAAAALGCAVTAGLTWFTVVLGFGPVDGLSSTFDAVFHYNAVAHVLRTGDASSLTIGALTNPAAGAALYPAGWHDLVSLVAQLSGAGIPVATNLTAWAVAGLVFPLSVLALTRQAVGPSSGAVFAAPVLATGFTAFPWALMSFGVLWPNLLAVAVLPACVALVAALVGMTERGVVRPVGAGLLLVFAIPALGLAHPNAVFSLAVVGLFPVLWAILRLARRRLWGPRAWQPVLALAALAGTLWGVLWMMTSSPLTEGVRSFDWPAFVDTPGAVAEVLWNASNTRPQLVVLSVLVVVGAVAALRRATTSWLVPAHLAGGTLYVLAASDDGELSAALTGAWYNDSYRLAAIVPVTGAPLAVVGLLTLAWLLRSALLRVPSLVPTLRGRGVYAGTVVVLAAVLLGVTGGLHVTTHSSVLASPYQNTPDQLLEPGQRAFLLQVGEIVPEDDVVATDPFTGNALLYPLTGREVVFPHLTGNWSPDQTVLATRFRDVAVDPEVCTAASAVRARWLLSGPVSFWPWHGGARWYPGLHDIAPVPGFELVASGGGQELWRVTACDTDPSDLPDTQAMDAEGPPVPDPEP
ncbi:DUF6541 family protein [Pseudonocardia sp. HH130630-07]|uniref:DUF6541 family protein n=1 Tax=Pseudonocardia sp. HH130630-07 TaxID=1690815 RepID=UPI000814E90E|nr:DUF6541 family protein [Pseudonocardia sp. HH130630-07]ANY06639.1 hypothetical protein AFB00_10410 [Pseudonocardia sp. HH130630-07]